MQDKMLHNLLLIIVCSFRINWRCLHLFAYERNSAPSQLGAIVLLLGRICTLLPGMWLVPHQAARMRPGAGGTACISVGVIFTLGAKKGTRQRHTMHRAFPKIGEMKAKLKQSRGQCSKLQETLLKSMEQQSQSSS